VRQRIDKPFILGCLAAIARGAGRPPSRSEFISLSGIPEHQVTQFFPTWNGAVKAAGLQPHTLNERLEDRELLEDWASAVRKNRKPPPRRTYRHLGKFDHRTFERRFGPWSSLPDVFRTFAQGKSEWAAQWADVVALLPAAKPAPIQRHNDFVYVGSEKTKRCHPEGGFRPKDLSSPSPKSARDPLPDSVILTGAKNPMQCKTAETATIPAFPNNDCRPRPQSSSKLSPAKLRHPPLHGRPSYGQPMDFRGLRHEPVNEQGVVLLFGMVAKELGYIVEAVQSGFPDCEAKRQIAPQRWQRVHIEFEFESRNFRDHGHPLTGCDIIVCWRHNWPACPPQIEVLELSSLLKSLPSSAP
jgi:hypothetical protein